MKKLTSVVLAVCLLASCTKSDLDRIISALGTAAPLVASFHLGNEMSQKLLSDFGAAQKAVEALRDGKAGVQTAFDAISALTANHISNPIAQERINALAATARSLIAKEKGQGGADSNVKVEDLEKLMKPLDK